MRSLRLGAKRFSVLSARRIAVGDAIPSAQLSKRGPGDTVDIAERVKAGKHLIVGVPGAFSPACSASHVPGYLVAWKTLHDKGVEGIHVVAVNDAFVTSAWAQSLGAEGSLEILADPAGEFTRAIDMEFDASKFFGNPRSKRYAMLVEDGRVKKIFLEPDSTGLDVSRAEEVARNI
ncbi:hypothetical protein CANCADRAFT_25688 [Tortispora caseinolytica NRRL Y-17796]|uniref:Thioredoxin peroxidase n=1 Tax=Tortispora caseinolytica NRRL Y-17796 TaxID=767744 RepID=A0A1E4TGP4_9ASCO|nr:hypothetical protein CANCADRAFT_25688 [Tortispora caseinolytica NRRL Y-17796]